MAVYRKVTTEVYCDVCGARIIGWHSTRNGVSIAWAKYHVREKGCTTGKRIVCKDCRIKKRINTCSIQRKIGSAGRDGNGDCLGFGSETSDEPIEQCKRCIACTAYEWEE